MLSRIAESLFWIGRYVERADDTARILDVHMQALVEDPWVDEDASSRSLLGVMGVATVDGEKLDRNQVMARLAFDGSNTSSVVGSLRAARENCRGAREAVSMEMWECVNVTYNHLPTQRAAAARLGPHAFCRFVRERAAMLSGVADATMSRDDSWRFMILGRSLERVDMAARLLSTRVLGGDVAPSWTNLLRSCGAYHPFLRTYRTSIDEARAVEFLLLDRLFPRSVFWALSIAEQCLADLDRDRTRTGVGDEGRRLLGRARTTLEFRSAEELMDDLPEHLDALQHTCSQVSDAVTRRYFQLEAPIEWAAGGSP